MKYLNYKQHSRAEKYASLLLAYVNSEITLLVISITFNLDIYLISAVSIAILAALVFARNRIYSNIGNYSLITLPNLLALLLIFAIK